jgi:cytoskeletal protein CcmA (bactofilin family)
MSGKQDISIKNFKKLIKHYKPNKPRGKEGRTEMIKSSKTVQTLGPKMTLEGKLVFEGTVRLDGHLKGTIESKEGMMIVGEGAVVHANILVHTATVSGEVRGNIRASDRIELHPPARVFGDLIAPVVLIDAGVTFDGKCSTAPKKEAPSEPVQLQSAS